jgi:hypothetical protein
MRAPYETRIRNRKTAQSGGYGERLHFCRIGPKPIPPCSPSRLVALSRCPDAVVSLPHSDFRRQWHEGDQRAINGRDGWEHGAAQFDGCHDVVVRPRLLIREAVEGGCAIIHHCRALVRQRQYQAILVTLHGQRTFSALAGSLNYSSVRVPPLGASDNRRVIVARIIFRVTNSS